MPTTKEDESFGLRLSNPSGGEVFIPYPEKYVSLSDNDSLNIGFKSGIYNIIEEEGQASIPVVRKGSTEEKETVHYYTEAQSAGNDDFIPVTGNLTFEAGETVKTLRIPILDDQLVEYMEQFYVSLSSGTSTKVVIYDKDHLK